MILPRYTALALLASYATVGAFTSPRTSIGLHHVVAPTTGPAAAHSSFDPSLRFWKKDDVQTDSPAAAIDTYIDGTFEKEEIDVPVSTVALVGSSLFLFTFVMQRLQIYLNTDCLNGKEICTEEYHAFSEFFRDHEFLSFMMILTHSIPFVLLPWVSKQISEVGPTIKKDFEGFNPFLMQMAMACIGFGLSLEFGWHVADSWYYENNFHVLNFGFYFFLISGFALWADGFKNIPIMDLVFGLILATATGLYPLGNAAQVGADDRVPEFLADFLSGGGGSAKIPLYAGMTATFLSITRRGTEVFGKSMYWVPFFCIVINLSFIFALDTVQYGNAVVDPVTGIKELTDLNYILHICHDILGTEMGVLVFGLLIKNYVPVAQRVEE